jgi:Protein of unknown function (DUF2439)
MTSTAVVSTPNLSIPLTQNTAPVLEFRCLYTHDIRKKAKKWQDGFLRFHTFNKRVMVYDGPRNFIGDVHWRQSEQVEDGDELQLDKGVLVQVQENIGRTEQDVTEVVAKRRNVDEPSASTTQAPPASLRAKNAASSQLRPKSLNSLLGIIKAPIGRAHLPARSPFEVRQQENQTGRELSGAEPPTKRRRISNDESPSDTLESPTHQHNDDSRKSNAIPRGREGAPQPARKGKDKNKQIIDISDDDGPLRKARATPASKSTFKVPKPVQDSPDSAPSRPKSTTKPKKPTKQNMPRPREPSPEEFLTPKPKKSNSSRSKARPTEDEDNETADTPFRSKKAGSSRTLPSDDSPAKRSRGFDVLRDDERARVAKKRKETQKKTLAAKQKEAESLLQAQQERVAERLKQAQRRKDEEREKEAQRKREAERRKSPSHPLPTNLLRFAPSKPVRSIMYKDLLPKPKPSPPAPGGTQQAIEDMQRQTREGQARIQERLGRRRLSDTSYVELVEEVEEDPFNDSDDVPDLGDLQGPSEDGTLQTSNNKPPSPGRPRSQGSLPQQQSPRQSSLRQSLQRSPLKQSPLQSTLQQNPQPSPLQSPQQTALQSPTRPLRPQDPAQSHPEQHNIPLPPSYPSNTPPNNDPLPPLQRPSKPATPPPPLKSFSHTPRSSSSNRTGPIFATPTQNTLTLLDQQLLLHSRPPTSNGIPNPGSAKASNSAVVVPRSPPQPLPGLPRSELQGLPPNINVMTATSNPPPLQPFRVPQPQPPKPTAIRQIGLPPPRPIAKPPRTLHPNARPPPQPQIQQRRQPPPTRTVIMRRSNSNTSEDSNDSRAGEKSPSWAGMKPWSAEAWDILGWWPPEYDRIG